MSENSIVVCVNALYIQPYVTMLFNNNETALERFIRLVSQLKYRVLLFIDNKQERIQTALNSTSNMHAVVVDEACTVASFLAVMQQHSAHAEIIIYTRADAPFLDIPRTRELVAVHKKYVAEYTFADGYPHGITPEIFNIDIIPPLQKLCRADEKMRLDTTMFSIIERDINAFDIETELAPRDMRQLRLHLYCDSRNNYLMSKALAQKYDALHDDLLAVITNNQRLLRQAPMFIGVELVARHSQHVRYSPYEILQNKRTITEDELSIPQLQTLLRQIADLSPECMLYGSLWGEIGLHTQVDQLLAMSNDFPMKFVIETSGVGWSADSISFILKNPLPNITWIVALDSNQAERYTQLRGDGFEQAQRFAHTLLDTYPERTYIQATRMSDTEQELESFYREWKKHTENIIILKYDHFCNLLPDKKVTDISPIKRMPCWHIKRDLSILIDGTVPLCREDIALKHTLGNVFATSLEAVWSNGLQYYESHLAERYPQLCTGCDEYYTYNN